VPMVLFSWDRDQPGVAARAKRLGLAKVVPRSNADPQEVRKAVTALLEDPRYREAAAHHSNRLGTTDSIGIACLLIEDFLVTVE
jgi:UDP:flavonoid glycosyltransferase YjiC (YdhE family)